MSTSTCARCGAPATLLCTGCKHGLDRNGASVEKTYYRSTSCQKNAPPQSQGRLQVIYGPQAVIPPLFRTGDSAKTIAHAVPKQTFAAEIEKVERGADNKLRVHLSKNLGAAAFYRFPKKLFDSEKEIHKVLSAVSGRENLANLGSFVEKCLIAIESSTNLKTEKVTEPQLIFHACLQINIVQDCDIATPLKHHAKPWITPGRYGNDTGEKKCHASFHVDICERLKGVCVDWETRKEQVIVQVLKGDEATYLTAKDELVSLAERSAIAFVAGRQADVRLDDTVADNRARKAEMETKSAGRGAEEETQAVGVAQVAEDAMAAEEVKAAEGFQAAEEAKDAQ